LSKLPKSAREIRIVNVDCVSLCWGDAVGWLSVW
jgi:hypothetical protein